MSTGRLGAGDTAIQPTILDAKGDLLTATAADTPARLAVGSNGQVLKADSTTATGLAWGSDNNGLVLIKTATFSNVADTGTTFDDVITSTYDNYIINFNNIYGATSTADFHLQFRYGTTTQATNYQSQFSQLNAFGTVTQTLVGTSGAAQFVLANDVGGTAGYGTNGVIELHRISGTDSRLMINWRLYNEWENTVHGGGFAYQNRTYTGFLMKASTGNIYGTVSIYGQAK